MASVMDDSQDRPGSETPEAAAAPKRRMVMKPLIIPDEPVDDLMSTASSSGVSDLRTGSPYVSGQMESITSLTERKLENVENATLDRQEKELMTLRKRVSGHKYNVTVVKANLEEREESLCEEVSKQMHHNHRYDSRQLAEYFKVLRGIREMKVEIAALIDLKNRRKEMAIIRENAVFDEN